MANVPQRRRTLGELYKIGRPFKIDDGATEWVNVLDENQAIVRDANGEPVLNEVPLGPVEVWLHKLTDIEMSTVFRNAGAAMSRVIAGRRSRDSDDWHAIRSDVTLTFSRDECIEQLTDNEMTGKRALLEDKVKGFTHPGPDGEDELGEWGKDGYADGLLEAWHKGLKGIHALKPEDPEANRVLSEIERFNAEVDEEWKYEVEQERAVFEARSDEDLIDQLTDLLVDRMGKIAWVDEYNINVLFLATRKCEGVDPDNKTKCLCRGSNRKHEEFHFGSIEEARGVDKDIRDKMIEAYESFVVDVISGKGSPGNPASSTVSASPAAAASDSSGPTAADA